MPSPAEPDIEVLAGAEVEAGLEARLVAGAEMTSFGEPLTPDVKAEPLLASGANRPVEPTLVDDGEPALAVPLVWGAAGETKNSTLSMKAMKNFKIIRNST
jgi:hypothetical protein